MQDSKQIELVIHLLGSSLNRYSVVPSALTLPTLTLLVIQKWDL